MKKNKFYSNAASDFWLEDSVELENVGDNLMELSSYRRAVANFVRIVTGDNIPVRYSSGNDSYTDGSSITISASTKLSERDSMVGLALHEGSHVKLTDFKLCQRIMSDVTYMTETYPAIQRILVAGTSWSDAYVIKDYLKDLHNYVEDRRIDHFVMQSAPGYRPYYQALYDRYFNAKIISKGLRSGEFRDETWNSYLFRLINITNPDSDLDALRGLRRIYEILDLDNISRLKSTSDSIDVAVQLLEVIHDCIYENWDKNNQPECQKPDDNNEDDTNNFGSGGGGGSDMGESKENDSSDDQNDENDSGQSNYDIPKLSDKDRIRLEKQLDQQRAFQAGDLKKKKVGRRSNDMITAIDESDTVVKTVAMGEGMPAVNVTVVRKFTRSLARSVSSCMWDSSPHHSYVQCIHDGLIKGTVLGKKLKVRAEERNTKFNRLRSGKIDKRMISQAGFGAEGIFQKIESFTYRPGIIHLSIDNSGSMSGLAFRNSLTTATAIAKACSMIENMDCVISFRSAGKLAGSPEQPIIVIAYDSRRQSIAELRTLLPYFTTAGTTPEGLCFAAIMDEVLDSSKGKDAYFVNFSDGEPYYYSRQKGIPPIYYNGEMAYTHTRKQINNMMANGIKVISYFICGSNVEENAAFIKMYGQGARFIDLMSINQVAKTMNDKFLEVV